jgi:metallo-beta-lactamase class B
MSPMVLCIVFCIAQVTFAQNRGEHGAPPSSNRDNAQSYVDAAKKIAGNDGLLVNHFNFFCIPANTSPNNPNASTLEAIKLFDNVYAIGDSETTVYAITTSNGILLIDSGYADRVDAVLVPGLQKLGLDPSKVKYIVLGHGHAHVFGGAKYFQDRYATKVGASAADWDLIDPPNPPLNQNANANQTRLKKDLILTDGQPIKFADLTLTPVAIPGHTPGSLAFIFPIKDKGKTRMAGIFGGAVLTLNRITTDGLKQYTQSIGHYLETSKKMKVEVELQNAIFDGIPGKLASLNSGDRNPFVVEMSRYIKMWNIVSECIHAEIARRGEKSD